MRQPTFFASTICLFTLAAGVYSAIGQIAPGGTSENAVSARIIGIEVKWHPVDEVPPPEFIRPLTESLTYKWAKQDSAFLSAIFALFSAGFAFFTWRTIKNQTCIAKESRQLHATLAHLEQVKFQLETLMRGGSMNLGQQRLSFTEGKQQSAMKESIVLQICGENSTDGHRVEIEELVDRWMSIEKYLEHELPRLRR